MIGHRFDAVAKLLADRRVSRRTALRGLAAGGAATVAAVQARPGFGMADTPPADADAKTEFLFVQSFQSGGFAPKAGSPDAFKLTLEHGLGQTVYFSDRPERIGGVAPTTKFLDGFGFQPDNPPNAALVLEAAPGDTDVVVLELTAPRYDEATKTATYDAKVLSDYEKLGVDFQEQPTTAQTLHEQFGAASLVFDDCPDLLYCSNKLMGVGVCVNLPGGPVGTCWNWSHLCCDPCFTSRDALADLCNSTYPACKGQCGARWDCGGPP
jgi:hypothetical protein